MKFSVYGASSTAATVLRRVLREDTGRDASPLMYGTPVGNARNIRSGVFLRVRFKNDVLIGLGDQHYRFSEEAGANRGKALCRNRTTLYRSRGKKSRVRLLGDNDGARGASETVCHTP